MKARTVKKLIQGKAKSDGAGVKLVRVFGYHDVYDFDPFLMLDAFDSTTPEAYIKGFPWHPHRGIETVTYLISGDVEHGDSLGNAGSIKDGDCQWMTAGSGIIHQEMPKPVERLLGVQLWVNLPAKDKMTNPEYRDIVSEDIPEVKVGTNIIKVISGDYKGISGGTQGDFVKTLFLDVQMDKNSEWSLKTDEELTVFAYIFEGEGKFDPSSDELISEKNAFLFNNGEKVVVKTFDKKMRFIVVAGKPLKEPIAWGGPIVMNTKEELDKAFEEIDNKTFIKHK